MKADLSLPVRVITSCKSAILTVAGIQSLLPILPLSSRILPSLRRGYSTALLPFLIAIFILAMFAPMLGGAAPQVQADSPWTIDGDKVYVDNKDYYISASPHTLYSSGWVTIEFQSKKYDSVDLLFSFEGDDGVETTRVQLETELERLVYVDEEQLAIVYNNITEVYEWVVQTVSVPHIEYYTGFGNVDISASPTGKDGDWSVAKIKDKLDKDTLYTARVWVDIPVSLTPVLGKYSIGLLPWGKSIDEADSMGLLYLLDPWYNSSWTYRQEMQVDGSAVGAQTNYTMRIIAMNTTGASSGNTVYLKNHAQYDFDDVRFTEADGETLLDYWVENYTVGSIAYFWVEFDAIPADPDHTNFYIYYGNDAASSLSNAANTWLQFNDGTSIAGWTVVTVSGGQAITWTPTGGVIHTTSPGGAGDSYLTSNTQAPDDYRLGMKLKADVGLSEDNYQPGFVFDTAQDNSGWILRWLEYTDFDYWRFDLQDNQCNSDPDHAHDIGNWVIYEIEKYDNDWEFYANHVSRVTCVDAHDYNYVGMHAYHHDSASWIDFDDFWVGKFVSPEPTFGAWSSEETEAGIPIVDTDAATNISYTTGTVGGDVTNLSGANIDERGFDWDIDSGAPYADEWTELGDWGTGTFTHDLTGLPVWTTIYFRAKAHNTGGWGYGNELSFTTLLYPPDAPTNFNITALGGNLLAINFTVAVDTDADTTLIMGNSGSYPTDKEDGWVTCNTTSNSCTDSHGLSSDFEQPYFRAWSYNETSGFSTDYAQGTLGGGSMFIFLGILGLAFGLTVICFKWKEVLLSYAAGLTWLAIGFWWMLGDVTNFGLDDPWGKILVFIPFIMFFVVMLRLMNTEIQMEDKGKRWTEWGSKPVKRLPSNYEAYKQELRSRTRPAPRRRR